MTIAPVFDIDPRFRWTDFLRRTVGDVSAIGPMADSSFNLVSARYGEPGRAYHSLAHVMWCLDLANEFGLPKEAFGDRVELALWFHDIVYDPRRKDNEDKSARVAYGMGILLGFRPATDIAKAHDDILMTTHALAPSEADRLGVHLDHATKWVLDIDLASLGFDPELFDKHGAMIREEYSWVPEDLYRTNRARILQDFLDRAESPHGLYYTQACRDRYEGRARENLKRAIKKLEG